jgi:hypothetical protein
VFDPEFKKIIMDAADGANKIPKELKDFSGQELKELVDHIISKIPSLLKDLRK